MAGSTGKSENSMAESKYCLLLYFNFLLKVYLKFDKLKACSFLENCFLHLFFTQVFTLI